MQVALYGKGEEVHLNFDNRVARVKPKTSGLVTLVAIPKGDKATFTFNARALNPDKLEDSWLSLTWFLVALLVLVILLYICMIIAVLYKAGLFKKVHQPAN